MVKKIALIGAGQLGSRHLQGLAKIKLPSAIQVVDPSTASLDLAKERYYEMPLNPQVESIEFLNSIKGLQSSLDFCIIATTSDIRLSVLQELLSGKSVKNILLEKVLFQSDKEFDICTDLLRKNEINAWVNCNRRSFPIYQEIKQRINSDKIISYCFVGKSWGLGCNGIHFLDHLAWLANDKLTELRTDDLDNKLYESKRAGFLEFTGCMEGFYSRGSRLVLKSLEEYEKPIKLEIETEKLRIEVFETLGLAYLFNKSSDQIGEKAELKFKMPYQNEQTHLVAEQVLIKGNCDLPKYEETIANHRMFIRELLRHIERITGEKLERCPIT